MTVIEQLRAIAEAGIAAHDQMLEIGSGIGALTNDEAEALVRHELTFGMRGDPTPRVVLALLDVVAAAAGIEITVHPGSGVVVSGGQEFRAALARLDEAEFPAVDL